ncbi:MAG: 30S ribosomal protein S4e [Thermoprotei archaeon]|jgi:small subunit ribosomal protein S4e
MTGHLKREAAPFYWPILRKEYTWTIRPLPGPHPLKFSIPLLLIVRDMLKYAETYKEAKKIIKRGFIKIDGKVRRDESFPVGLMDIVELIPTGETYRLLPYSRYPLTLVKIPDTEKDIKIGKVINKQRIKYGKIQVTLHDGRNILLDPSSTDIPNTYDSLVVKLSTNEIVQRIPLIPGSYGLAYAGRSVSKHGKIIEVRHLMPKYRSISVLDIGDGKSLSVGIKNLILIGINSPLIKLPGGDSDVITGKSHE